VVEVERRGGPDHRGRGRRNCNFRYGAALTPGARYFLSETVTGGLQTTVATSAQAKAIGFAVDDTRIRLVPTT
jgi:hypothetical protein